MEEETLMNVEEEYLSLQEKKEVSADFNAAACEKSGNLFEIHES